MMARTSRGKAPAGFQGNSGGWHPSTAGALKKLIHSGAGKRLPVVFDFDNTLVCGDIGEATLAVLAREGRLEKNSIPSTLCPAFRDVKGRLVTMNSCVDVTEYYEALLAPTVHRDHDPTPLANGYVWAVEILEGLRIADVLGATKTAFEMSRPGTLIPIEVTPGRTAYPAPFFYQEMVELIAALMRKSFDVWIVSASNVWTVRWMVRNGLNPLLRRLGLNTGVPLEQVLGISTLLCDQHGNLYKDRVLVQENRAYLNLADREVSQFRLTSRLQFPVPTYSGKIACIQDSLGRAPWLAVGDGCGDHAMLLQSEHKLWLARLEKPADQQKTVALIGSKGQRNWLVQPIRSRDAPGFLSSLDSARISGRALEESLRILRGLEQFSKKSKARVRRRRSLLPCD